ncbi:transmembrane protein, putative (macronuclear) [Tetrahymena thermophila SB210]|uniref:Transmembrane protein, putative n=1 Tax=Tetrahymena thermophila (strain SB210) TaxID=312017 RepID=Q236W5_TETTS|nr:transmembrane protein, putative [Tetrahymena thermophila SB210]EAR92385.2 transmembrane protein, putative [Tetrahymena thermophila SB210]|eukprot:XP_001012630.2 transmembrane protein, putative [Tetrahymena thermophila SB210]
MTGKLSNWIESTEKYSILYINFEYEGKKYLGQACASSFFQAKTISPIYPYIFYYKNDYIQCGPTDGNRTSPQYHRILPQNNQNQIQVDNHQRLLKSSSSHSSSSNPSSSSNSSSSESCLGEYLWSDVKIASWLCQEKYFNVEDYMDPRDCYVNFFNGNKAFMNGLLRYPMKDVYSFPLVSYKPYAYFPKIELICLILFSYYNWILSFNSIFLYTTNCILQNMKNLQKHMLFLKIIPNPTKQEQTSQELLKLKPKINQLDQPQINAVINNQIHDIPQLQQIENPILSPNQDQQQLNSSPQINQVQRYQIERVTEQNNMYSEDNVLKRDIEILNPKTLNEIPAQTLAGVEDQLKIDNEDKQNNMYSEDNVLKRDIEIQNPKTLNEIPAQTIAGVEDQLKMDNEDNIIKPGFVNHQIQKSIF